MTIQAPPSPPEQAAEPQSAPKKAEIKPKVNSDLVPLGWCKDEVDVIPGIPASNLAGRKTIPVWVNQIELTHVMPAAGYNQYDMKILKKNAEGQFIEVSNVNLKEKILVAWNIIEEYFEKKFKRKIMLGSDFAKTLYSIEDLTEGGLKKELDIEFDFVRNDKKETLVLQIHKTTDIGSAPDENLRLTQYVRKPMDNLRSGKLIRAELVNLERVINVVVKTSPTLTSDSIGHNSFYEKKPTTDGFGIGGGLVSKTGYSLLWSLGWRPFLTVDLSNAPFIMGKPVMEVLENLFGQKQKPYDVFSWTQHDFDKADDLLKGIRVEYNTSGSGVIQKRITEFSRTMKSASQFEFDWEGVKSNVAYYFKKKYNKNVLHPNGPVLMVGSTEGCAVPAEVSIIFYFIRHSYLISCTNKKKILLPVLQSFDKPNI